jgi:hypothetical protein
LGDATASRSLRRPANSISTRGGYGPAASIALEPGIARLSSQPPLSGSLIRVHGVTIFLA